MNEEWKDIIGFEGLYQISNFGNVKSLNYRKTEKEQILKPQKGNDGYLQVGLWKNGKYNSYKIHRLVAQAFIPNEDLFKTIVNHIDENKENNTVENLEWCTQEYNNNYGTHQERCAIAKLNHPNMSKPVNQYSPDGNFIQSFQSIREVERQLGYPHQTISACCNGKYKSAYEFIWEYA